MLTAAGLDLSGALGDNSLKKWKFIHYPHTLMPIDGQDYFFKPQNIAGVLQENGVAESPKQLKGTVTSFQI